MLRADYRESISQAVSGIRDMPSLEGRSKAAIAQAVVLRLLAAAGWDVFDLSQVMPGYVTGTSNIDFALMPPGQPKPESTEGGRQVSVLKRQEGAPLNLG